MKITKEEVNTVMIEYRDITNYPCYVSVTDWVNGEGYDITVSGKRYEKTLSLTYDEVLALNLGISALGLDIIKDENKCVR